MSHLRRVPAGVATGGQFATMGRAEPHVTLTGAGTPEDRSGDDGTGPTVEEPEAYHSAFEAAQGVYEHAKNELSRLPSHRRRERLAEVSAEYEVSAIRHASAADVSEIPRWRENILNHTTGNVVSAANAAADARVASQGGSTMLDARSYVEDAIVERAFDTREFTTANGVPLRARIVRRGTTYGRTGGKVAEADMVFFFDARYDHAPMVNTIEGGFDDTGGERNGQFVSSYYVDTLLESGLRGGGLALDSGFAEWSIDANSYRDVHAWMTKRAR